MHRSHSLAARFNAPLTDEEFIEYCELRERVLRRAWRRAQLDVDWTDDYQHFVRDKLRLNVLEERAYGALS